jgi:hypothetical protein
MAATITAGTQYGGAASAAIYFRKVTFLCDDSYVTGGYAFDVYDYVPKGALPVGGHFIQMGPVTQVAYKALHDPSTNKMKVMAVTCHDGAAPTIAEVANGTNLTGVTFDLLAITG